MVVYRARVRRCAVATVVVGVVFLFAHAARAAATDNVSGWAWNASAGWVSANSENCVALNRAMDPDPCALAGRSYGLTIARTGFLSGYAWSQAAGWLCVGATCGGTGGTVPSGGWTARVNAVTGEVTGWAKVLGLGDRGWVSFSCMNTATCGSIAYRTTVNVATGAFDGHAWNGAPGAPSLGWIAWRPAFGGVTTTWRPEPVCTVSGAACASDGDCLLQGERCCLGGAPCGRCGGEGAACGSDAACPPGERCCPPGVDCGRCVASGLACGTDADCGGGRDACCPPGAVCGGGGDGGGGTGGDGGGGGTDGGGTTFESPIGICTTSEQLCVDGTQCGGATCERPATLCAESSVRCGDAEPCTGGAACVAEIGLCTANGAAGPVRCAGDGACAALDEDATCRTTIGKCTASNQLCVADANCGGASNRCGKLYLPWLATQYGSIYSTGDVGSSRTPPPPAGAVNATYCILAGGRIVNFVSASRECGVRPAYGGPAFPAGPTYRSADAHLDVPRILRGGFGRVVPLTSGKLVPGAPPFDAPLGGAVYLADGLNVEVGDTGVEIRFRNGVAAQSGAGLIVIRGGNLRIKSNMAYDVGAVSEVGQIASPGFLALKGPDGRGGNITIEPNVSALVGAFYAEGTIRTRTTGKAATDVSLTVSGLMTAREFQFERLTAARGQPAERIIADGRALVNPPPGFGDFAKALPVIRQTAP